MSKTRSRTKPHSPNNEAKPHSPTSRTPARGKGLKSSLPTAPFLGCPPDPISQADCAYAISILTPTMSNLAATATVLTQAIRTGDWSNPMTWSSGVPTAASWVSIPKGITVTVDGLGMVARLLTVYGTLAFRTDVDTSLFLDTLYTPSSDDGGPGCLTIGTKDHPLQPNVKCTLTFMAGAINRSWDPKELSRGIITHGYTSLYGAEVSYDPTNLTRNLTLTSAGSTFEEFGHVMFMHSDQVSLAYVAFLNLGRTDKSQPIGTVYPDGFVNVRARYAAHFHRQLWNNQQNGGAPVQVVGCVGQGGPGWGFVNHSSNVVFTDCIGTGCYGANLVTEAGDELGAFVHCYSSNTVSRTSADDGSRSGIGDFGFTGSGFWLQGPAVKVQNCTAVNCQYGYDFYTLGLTIPGQPTVMFPIAQTPDPQDYGTLTYIPVSSVPVTPDGFQGNTAKNCTFGAKFQYRQVNVTRQNPGVFVDNFTVTDAACGINFSKYDNNVTVQNSTVGAAPGVINLTNTQTPLGNAIYLNPGYIGSTQITNVESHGFARGLNPQARGGVVVTGGIWDDKVAFHIWAQFGPPGGKTTFTGDIQFGPQNVTRYYLAPPVPQMQAYIAQNANPANTAGLFAPVHIELPDGSWLYWTVQTPGAIPFPSTTNWGILPSQYYDLTEAELEASYGVAVLGFTVPADSATQTWTNGLVGQAQVSQ